MKDIYTITIPDLYEVGSNNKIENISIEVDDSMIYIKYITDNKNLEQRFNNSVSRYPHDGWISKELLNKLIKNES